MRLEEVEEELSPAQQWSRDVTALLRHVPAQAGEDEGYLATTLINLAQWLSKGFFSTRHTWRSYRHIVC